MSIRGICPECGFAGDMAAFVAQGEHNQALAAALEIPSTLGPRVVRYLGLFRPQRKALAGAKALRLLTELRDAIAEGHIQRSGVSRPAPVHVWATALDKLLERPPTKLPLQSHGYLFEVVAGVADKADAAAERKREEAARSGAKAGANRAPAPSRGERSTEDVLAEHRRLASQGEARPQPQPGGPKRLGQLLEGAPRPQEQEPES
ncbi:MULTISPECIES: hypothetical protein [Halomonas]|uniref:DUF2752 domain-containing protein n=1 Tax=Halomonas halophila TaxID=29573 RepID=A0ABQ0TZV2_9GAMM|nr:MULTISPECIES: hypothetical protein [Halomonas]MDR5889666.1 hypothetical protein [Halomonas salina]WJY06348.1 hypothetical protein QWG60_11585 [Halomonas halophila]GEK71565.1 hypothetical protein HHA04nite_01090 [Halomonas halophila]